MKFKYTYIEFIKIFYHNCSYISLAEAFVLGIIILKTELGQMKIFLCSPLDLKIPSFRNSTLSPVSVRKNPPKKLLGLHSSLEHYRVIGAQNFYSHNEAYQPMVFITDVTLRFTSDGN